MKKIIFFGNQKALIDCIEYSIKQKDVKISLVVGCENENDVKDGNPSIERYCKVNNIPFVNQEEIDDDFLNLVSEISPDVCFSILYRKIFKENLISIPRNGFINIHPSLLPKYRGPIPRVWAMLSGEEVLGTTIHYIDKGIDTGDIIDQKSVKIDENITGHQLNTILNDLGVDLFKKNFKSIISGKAERKVQNHSEASYYGAFNQKIRHIDWFEPTKIILRRINLMTKPYSGAIAVLDNDENMIIWKAEKYNFDKSKLNGPGKVFNLNDSSFCVTTIDGAIKVTDYSIQFKSKKFITR